MYKGKVSQKYGIEKTPLLLVAFEHEAHKEGVKKAINEGGFTTTFQGLEKFLFFTMQVNASNNWKDSWESIDGKPAVIF